MRYTKKLVKEMLAANPEMLYAPMPKEIRELFPVSTVDICSEYYGLHFTTKHNAKMSGFHSISTTCKKGKCPARVQAAFRLVIPDFNIKTATKEDIKKARKLLEEYVKENPEAKNVSICGFCFSDRQQDIMTNMTDPLSRNYKILNGGIIHTDWLPIINSLYFRIESFGDFASVNAVINVMNLIKKNPLVFFGVWSKNPGYFHKYFGGNASLKPVNCNILLSGQYINKVPSIPSKYAYFIDKTFTVFTKVYANKNSVCINCGARACLGCLKCYTKNDVTEIREMLK